MNRTTKALKTRLLSFCLVIALTPISIMAWRTYVNIGKIEHDLVHSFGEQAIQTIDIIERNLFERYGDVQAFSANETVLNTEQWGKKSADENGITRAMNTYMDLYDIYTSMLAVDLEGNPIAVNTLDADGKSISTDWVYEMNFKNAPWFRKAINGDFLRGSGTDGTVVEDVHEDPIVKRLVGGTGYAFSYSAPIRDSSGKTVGVWSNRVSIDLLNTIMEDSYRKLAEGGYSTAELTLLDKNGLILVDLDPSIKGGKIEANENPDVLLNLNLAKSGLIPAQRAIAGESSAMYSDHIRKGITQVTGYAHTHGALGYAGLGWSILIRIDENEAMASIINDKIEMIAIVLAALIIVPFASWRLASKIAKPIEGISHALLESAEFTRSSSKIVDRNAQTLADGSVMQAANVEETSSSTEELSSMTAQTTENVSAALKNVEAAANVANDANAQLEELKLAMAEISSASGETKNIIKTIDEIAFQTNILALNAAVEAARAGEAGAGFAIVADEVRNLAQRAADAANNTSALLDQNIEKITKGTRSVEKTNEGFRALLEMTSNVRTSMQAIDDASKQQNEGFGQINLSVTQISEITQQNAASAEEVASTAREMNGQSETIARLSAELDAIVSGASSARKPNAQSPTSKEDSDWNPPARKSESLSFSN